MQLELAEGNPLSLRSVVSSPSTNNKETVYLLVPDILEKRSPIYVRADLLQQLNQNDLNYLLASVSPWNSEANIKRVRSVLQNGISDEGASTDGTDYVETTNTVVTIVDTVLGWFEGSGSGQGSAPAAPGSIVGFNGFVACGQMINGNMILFGVHPARRQMIAFSTPNKFREFFPNIPSGFGTPMFPATPLPPLPNGMLNFVLTHPNQVVKEKIGGGFEVVPNALPVGTDNNGNPVVYPPAPKGDSTEGGSSMGKLIPLALLALLAS